MTYNYQILLGKISRINGYDGSVSIKLEPGFIENLPEMESVFLEISGKPVPFFISSSEYNGSDILKVRFEGYGFSEKLTEFSSCRVFLTHADQRSLPSRNIRNIIGFKAYHGDTELLGIISEIIYGPGQDLISIITSQKREILVPLHDDFIIEINYKKGFIRLILPDGLIDLY